MQTRVVNRLLFWLVQASLVTAAAWGLLRWNYLGALEDMVPLRIASVHHLWMLMLAMAVVTGGLAGAISLIFATRVEAQPLVNAGGVTACTCVALWAYIFYARAGGDAFEVNTVFLAGTKYQVYGVIVVLGVALLNGVLSLFAGTMNPPVRSK